jgi:hypothetical protein
MPDNGLSKCSDLRCFLPYAACSCAHQLARLEIHMFRLKAQYPFLAPVNPLDARSPAMPKELLQAPICHGTGAVDVDVLDLGARPQTLQEPHYGRPAEEFLLFLAVAHRRSE